MEWGWNKCGKGFVPIKTTLHLLTLHLKLVCGERSGADWLPCITQVDATYWCDISELRREGQSEAAPRLFLPAAVPAVRGISSHQL
ncbi:unnamed protein product [Boreogadus saida]